VQAVRRRVSRVKIKVRKRSRSDDVLSVAFDAGLPNARWGPLFHVFRLERRDVVFKWRSVGCPPRHSLPAEADIGLFVHAPSEAGLATHTLDISPMAVVMAAGHPLADRVALTVGDVLDQPFPGGTNHDPERTAFWTLDEYRGGPPGRTEDVVESDDQGLDIVAAGRAIVTMPMWAADSLWHPGVIGLPLTDGPDVTTRLVWRADDDNPAIRALADLATAWTGQAQGDERPPPPS
jgi:DNA-binding transcriptional LysR family regulator